MVPEDTLSFGPQTQRYIRAQKTRSKCRRCFTVLHHHTSLFRLTSPLHNSEFRQTKRRQNFPGYIHILNPGSSIPHNSKLQEESRSCSDCSWLDLKHHYCLDHLHKNFFVLCFPFSIPEVHFNKSKLNSALQRM